KAGDLSNDGKQDAADAVVLSKYLSGTGTLDGNLFFAADLNNDNRINAADLTCMKRQLIYAKNA
ncbi:MAG: dockerin type I repeat-containing protein, partial [Oscillospiraceae bacterium]|nr:dockerin type I repeat-containing protein [Oscillospiraceae bacterium]